MAMAEVSSALERARAVCEATDFKRRMIRAGVGSFGTLFAEADDAEEILFGHERQKQLRLERGEIAAFVFGERRFVHPGVLVVEVNALRAGFSLETANRGAGIGQIGNESQQGSREQTRGGTKPPSSRSTATRGMWRDSAIFVATLSRSGRFSTMERTSSLRASRICSAL